MLHTDLVLRTFCFFPQILETILVPFVAPTYLSEQRIELLLSTNLSYRECWHLRNIVDSLKFMLHSLFFVEILWNFVYRQKKFFLNWWSDCRVLQFWFLLVVAGIETESVLILCSLQKIVFDDGTRTIQRYHLVRLWKMICWTCHLGQKRASQKSSLFLFSPWKRKTSNFVFLCVFWKLESTVSQRADFKPQTRQKC